MNHTKHLIVNLAVLRDRPEQLVYSLKDGPVLLVEVWDDPEGSIGTLRYPCDCSEAAVERT